ncbi:MAG: adenylate/guanylate cyclase domain-containing protein [Candidatus Limnocylindrales bacterium]
MSRLQHKPLEHPDEVRPYPGGRTDIYQLDEMVFGRMRMEPGWRWSTDVKPIAGTPFCEYHHLGVVESGLLHVVAEDGTEMDVAAGEIFEIPPGHDSWVVGDQPWVAIDFRGARSFARPVVGIGDRVLETILFTDIVGSTATLERIGDAAWRDLLAQHDERVRFELDRFRGRDVASTGDGFLSLFDGAARAVSAAQAMSTSLAEIGIAIRAGVHTGEVEMVPDGVRGVAVHTAARIMALAGPGEVLVSATTAELATGSGLRFRDRGLHEFKGLTGARQVLALVTESAAA